MLGWLETQEAPRWCPGHGRRDDGGGERRAGLRRGLYARKDADSAGSAGSPGTDLGPVGGFETGRSAGSRSARHERVGWLVAEVVRHGAARTSHRLTTNGLARPSAGSGRPLRERGGRGCLYWAGERVGRLSAEARMPLEVWIIFMALVVAAVVLLPRILPPTGPTCTRCEGSGSVNERWPDPSKPGGWHELSGKCPKCDGKGRLRR